MRIGILTATISEELFFPNIIELKDKAESRRHKVDLFKNGEFTVLTQQGGTKLFLNGEPFNVKDYDVVLNRISVRDKHNGDYYVAEQFLAEGVSFFNTPESIMRARNKLLSLQMMSQVGVDITKSYVCRRYEDVLNATKYLEFPMILKNIYGSLGSSTLIVYDARQLKSMFDYIWNVNRNEIILIQEYIKPDKGSKYAEDYRAFVMGDKVVASMKRRNELDDFRANFKKGASVYSVELTEEEKEQAIKITQKFGLEIAGVDFMRTDDGPVFLEVNSNPGLEGIRKVTLSEGYDIIDRVIDYMETKKAAK